MHLLVATVPPAAVATGDRLVAVVMVRRVEVHRLVDMVLPVVATVDLLAAVAMEVLPVVAATAVLPAILAAMVRPERCRRASVRHRRKGSAQLVDRASVPREGVRQRCA